MLDEPLGREVPRIWTPPTSDLTDEANTLGYDCIRFAEEQLGMALAPWQRWLLIHGLELADDGSGLFRFDTVIVIVSRQNGKTELIKVKKLWRLYLDGAQTVIATAQDLANSEKALDESVELVKSSPDLMAEFESHDRTNGKRALELTEQRRYLVRAASRKAARGWSVDDLDMDELREHQSWDAWIAAAPTTLSRPRSQIWGWSSAGDAASVVLRHLRAQGMQNAVGCDPGEAESFAEGLGVAEADGEDVEMGSSLALFEWSAPPKAELDDWDARAQANPSLGHGFLTKRKLHGLMGAMSPWGARMEYMSQWRPTAAGGPFPDGAWEAGIDPESGIADDGQLISIGVAVSTGGGMAYVAVAGHRSDGNVHAEVIAQRAGIEWVVPWLTDPVRALRDRWGSMAWQVSGAPVSALTDDLRATDLPCSDWSGAELGRASGVVQELVRLPGPEDTAGKKRLYHVPQPVLDVPASTAAVSTGGGGSWVLDLKRSPTDVAPLQAVFAAVWGLTQVRAPFVSAYAEHDLLIV